MNFLPEILLAIFLVGGIFATIVWRKKKPDPDIVFFCLVWTCICLIFYFAGIELLNGGYFFIFPLAYLAIFLWSYFKNKARLLNGVLFNILIFVFGFYLIYNVSMTSSIVAFGLLGLAALFLASVLVFGFVSLIIFLYWNALIVLKKESRSLANMLTLLLAIFLTFFLVYDHFIAQRLPDWLTILLAALPVIMGYFALVFFNFLSVSILYQFNHPKPNQDYIIVLGAGLLNGDTVSPLLAKRIDVAINFYHHQIKVAGKHAKILMSGGQGHDEKLPEGAAMAEYAKAKGVAAADLLIEDQSTTTLENMRFSKRIMDQLQPMPYKVIFTSNNYHIFRAGIYARKAGLRADGIGAKTALYYLPNAFLREYIAIVALHKKRHLLVSILILALFVFLSVMSFFIV
ncbi:membrane protein [Enterococcus saigonensis]|uniref:Membrane protein n=1 Tax=Enterococcus saigonensis TaxID=1805431 RepID=A0A679IIZ1_9ENTE|nr:ElyC/SanA/YdcF family protein [Enterococcus saigonensis]BCA85405.1 membrane protein [Enterococcus saigonensis]